MPGLVPGIHVFRLSVGKEDVDGRDKPGHDGKRGVAISVSSVVNLYTGETK